MRIAIVGAGAIGSLFGGLLHEAGLEVSLIGRWREHIERIQTQGLLILQGEKERTINVKAYTSPKGIGTVDLVILLVKAYSTEEAVSQCLPLFGRDTFILSLQNGLGNKEGICQHVPPGRVLLGVTNQGAYVVMPGVVCHAGLGDTLLGPLEPSSWERAEDVVRAFNSAGLKSRIVSDLEGTIWGKLLINVGINPLGALTGRRNGELLEVPELCHLMKMAVAEAAEVARRKGVNLPYPDPFERVKEAARASASNKCSMLQDLERGKRTEVQAINGAVAAMAKELGIAAPVNEALTVLVKAREGNL